MKEILYTIEWSRINNPEKLTCTGLSPRTLTARLIKATRYNNVIIHNILPDKRSILKGQTDKLSD